MNQSTNPRKRILIVDDEPGVREVLGLLLGAEGHEIVQACNGREACLLFAPREFDLVITDLSMPEMNGDELARTIKCLVPSQPILMVTAMTEAVCSPENPVDAVLEKPFSSAELRKMVNLLLRSDLRESRRRPKTRQAAS